MPASTKFFLILCGFSAVGVWLTRLSGQTDTDDGWLFAYMRGSNRSLRLLLAGSIVALCVSLGVQVLSR